MNVEVGMLICLLSNHGNLAEPIFINLAQKLEQHTEHLFNFFPDVIPENIYSLHIFITL